MSSILNDVKHKIGPSGDYDYYDLDIIDAINTAFGTLSQLGVGPSTGFKIESDAEEWGDFTSNLIILDLVKTYVYQKVRLIFDPPNSSFVISAIQDNLKELEFRMNVEVDPGKETP